MPDPNGSTRSPRSLLLGANTLARATMNLHRLALGRLECQATSHDMKIGLTAPDPPEEL